MHPGYQTRGKTWKWTSDKWWRIWKGNTAGVSLRTLFFFSLHLCVRALRWCYRIRLSPVHHHHHHPGKRFLLSVAPHLISLHPSPPLLLLEFSKLLSTFLCERDPDFFFLVVVKVAGVAGAFALRDEGGFHLKTQVITFWWNIMKTITCTDEELFTNGDELKTGEIVRTL